MQVSIESTSSLERKMTIGLPKERVQEEVQNRLKSIAKTAKVDGFRPGKVPMRVIQQRYGQQVRIEVIDELIGSSFYEAVEQEKVRPAGQPHIDLNSDLKDLEADLSFTASFEVYPEFTELVWENLAIEKTVSDIQESDVDGMIEKLRQQRRTWKDVSRPIAKGDRAIINFEATVDGKDFPNNKLTEHPIFIGENFFILEGFEDALISANAGEEKSLTLKFPADYRNADLAGKDTQCHVKVLSVAEPELPDLDDEFAKTLGVEEGGIEALRKDVRTNMQRELENALKTDTKAKILDALLTANPLEIPKALLQEEASRLVEFNQQQLKSRGYGDLKLAPDMFLEQAKKRVHTGLLMGELMRKYEIKVDAERVRTLIDSIAATYEEPDAVVNYYYSDRQRLNEVEGAALEEQVIEFLLAKAQITEQALDFNSVIKRAQERKEA